MKVNNIVLKKRIDKWVCDNPANEKIFELFHGFIRIVDENAVNYKFSNLTLIKFIDGIIYTGYYYIEKDKESSFAKFCEERGSRFLNPVLLRIYKHATSEQYIEYIIKQQITGNNSITTNSVDVPIDIAGIELHSKRIGKIILTRKDVEDIERDFVKYYKEFYIEPIDDSKLRFSTKIDQIRMKAIHQYLYEEGFIDYDEASWLYWFDLQPWGNKKKSPSKIQWNKASYILSNIIFIICGNLEVRTETVMKNVFSLRKGKQFQKKTVFDRTKIPYKIIYDKMEMAHHSIK
jgi:hypothetical protein